jgi:hypothetical protein
MAKTNTEKITKEILEGLSEDTGDSDSYDAESGDEDSEDWPWWPSHSIFGKSTIKQSHLENMRGRYFRDMSIVRPSGDNNVPALEENEVVIYRRFFKAKLRFPLSKFVVEVLKTYQIFLHQITPEAIIRMRIFVWAVRSQGLEPSAKCFCSMHELLYETKAMGKEQYHNNFGCYGFIACPNASHPVPTFQKRWPGAWMEEWFYVKNDLKTREDIKEVIMRPIWSRFGLRRPKIEIDETVEACQKAFSTICSFIGTRDLIQEHIAFRVWPLVESWKMPKETITDSSEGGLVRLKYTFRFGDKFDEPNDDWLKCIEATSDELLGAYSKTEDNALSAAFGGRNKKRLNRVFDAIGFVYPDYCYPLRGQGVKRKIAASGKVASSAITAEPKGKKIKVLTHRPRYIELVVIPEFGEGASSAAETKETAPHAQSTKNPAVMPKLLSVQLVETKADKAEGPKIEETTKMPEILSPPTKVTVPKVQKGSAATPKRRMENVLDVVLKTTKTLSPALTRKVTEASKAQPEADTKHTEVKAATIQAETEAGPSVPTEMECADPKGKSTEWIATKKIEAPGPEALNKSIDYIICHASGKVLSQEEMLEAQHYAQKLKYPKGALVFNGCGEEDFLSCLPDNKEIFVCREIGKSIGFPKLEDGLSILSKDELADNLAYNSIKV